jgi:hypothetical protein
VLLTVVIERRHREPGIGAELDRHLWEGSLDEPNQALEDGECSPAGMTGPGTEHRGDELAGIAIEDQERVEHVLLVIAVVSDALLVAVRGVIGAIEVEDDALRDPVLSPLLQIELHECHGQAVAGFDVDSILQAREGGLAGEIGRVGQAATDQLQQRIRAESIRIILVFIATGDLEDPLADERLQRVTNRPASPVGDMGGESGTETKGSIRFREPAEAAIRGELRAIEGGGEA